MSEANSKGTGIVVVPVWTITPSGVVVVRALQNVLAFRLASDLNMTVAVLTTTSNEPIRDPLSHTEWSLFFTVRVYPICSTRLLKPGIPSKHT